MSDVVQVLIHFDESDSNLPPRDVAGGLGDIIPKLTLAEIVQSVSEHARVFEGASAFIATDNEGSLLTRDMTIQCLVQWDLVAQNALGENGTIIWRGTGASAAEYTCYGLHLEYVSAGVGKVVMSWQDTAGVLKTQTGAQFNIQADGYVLITATRKWVSPTEVEVKYYVNDLHLGTVTSVDGSIGGGTTGTTSIGAAFDGTLYNHKLCGKLDELRITNYAIPHEEIVDDWRMSSRFQPQGYETFRELLPPGLPISSDPSSRIQRLIHSIGASLGRVTGDLDSLRHHSLPDKAYGDILERWEKTLGYFPSPSDTIEKRRLRLQAFLARKAGYSHSSVKDALADLLDTDPSSLEIAEFSNRIRDDFATVEESRWWIGDEGAWGSGGTELTLSGVAGDDWRYTPELANAPFCVQPITSSFGMTAQVGINAGTFPLVGANSPIAGIFLWNFARRDALWFGYSYKNGDYNIAWMTMDGGVLSSMTVMPVLPDEVPTVRIRRQTTPSLLSAGRAYWDLEYSADGGSSWESAGTIEWINDPTFCGMGVTHEVTTTLGGALDIAFTNFLMHTPYGTRPFRWYVYRNPALGGTPDMQGAALAVNRIKPAHTVGAVITSYEVLCDTDGLGCDETPMGGI